MTPENIEAVGFVSEMVSKGYVDPASSTYTSDSVQSQWKAKQCAIGYDTGGLASDVGGAMAKDLESTSASVAPAIRWPASNGSRPASERPTGRACGLLACSGLSVVSEPPQNRHRRHA